MVQRGKPRLRLGMVGGGQDSFIGAVHRMAARLDDRYELVAGALSSTAERSQASGLALGLPSDRIYDDFISMVTKEAVRSDGIDVVAIVTPNDMHAEPAKAFLNAGIHVICDKPLAVSIDEARELLAVVKASPVRFLLTHNYSGYPMIREAKRLVNEGALGDIRIVNVEYIQGWLSDDVDNKQAAWRLDPNQAGAGGCIGDIGTHAYQLAEFVSGLQATALSAELSTFGVGRCLDDDADIRLKFGKTARGHLWATQIATGFENGLKLRVVGTCGSLEWAQENPNYLLHRKLNEPTQILSRAGVNFDAAARVPSGHPEGFIEAFATLYDEFATSILNNDSTESLLPGIQDGVRGLQFIEAAVRSSNRDSAWVELDGY